MSENSDRLEKALEITKRAANMSMSYFLNNPEFDTKADQSPVTIADKATERVIRDGLEQAFPGESIFGEEFGQTGDSGNTWIIDPIDGTRSYITGLPLFGILLGKLIDGRPELGIIQMPALSEIYTGAKGMSATCNGSLIKVSDCQFLDQAKLFINEGDKLALNEPEVFSRLIRAGNLRRLGADCYSHALVARGLVDAVVDYDLKPYDFLPVSAVVEAAGGIMTDWLGDPLSMHSDGRTLTAATPELHGQLLNLIHSGEIN